MPSKNQNSPTMLVILDGFGYSSNSEGNAIAQAKMPHWKKWLERYPNTLLDASGKAVGLLPGYMGNSEVGHLTIGAGRIIPSILVKFHQTIDDGSFADNRMLIERFTLLKTQNKALHLMGLLSDAGVHSHEYHLYAFLKLAKKIGVPRVYIHAFLDGRDTLPQSAETYLGRLETTCKELDIGTIASIHGRFYAMDRDQNWDRTQKTYDVVCGNIPQPTSPRNVVSWKTELSKAYKRGETDEFVTPTLLNPQGIIQSGDGVVFYNFRPERARQLTDAFLNPAFDHFPRKSLNLSFFITPTRYRKDFAQYNNDILFEHETVDHTMLDVLAQHHKRFFLIAETEKYAHITYFLKGEKEITLPGETAIFIPSIKSKHYVDHPAMSAREITKTLLESLRNDPNDFYAVNYANADMVGHSANLQATIKACEVLDGELEKLYQEVAVKQKGLLFITADHGNAEELLDPQTGKPTSTHSTNPVPFMMISDRNNKKAIKECTPSLGLSCIAPTILKQIGLPIPSEMIRKTIL